MSKKKPNSGRLVLEIVGKDSDVERRIFKAAHIEITEEVEEVFCRVQNEEKRVEITTVTTIRISDYTEADEFAYCYNDMDELVEKIQISKASS